MQMWTVPAEKPQATVTAAGINSEFIPAYCYLRAENKDSHK